MVVVLQILELLSGLGVLVLLGIGRPLLELAIGFGLLYLVQVGELGVEWRERRGASDLPGRSFLLYLVPGAILLRRLVEFSIATLFVRLYLCLQMLLVLATLPLTLLGQAERVGWLYDRLDRSVEPLLDVLLRAYNAISLNPHPPGETGMVLAIPMPFRDKLL